jgi:hypothetical protein
MDLSNYEISASSNEEGLEPGRYTLEYVSDEMIEGGTNGWVALKATFKVKTEGNYFVSATFALEHNNPKVVEIGLDKLAKLARACGLDNLKNSDELVGKLVSAEVVLNKNGYPEVNGEDYGKTYQPVNQEAAPKKVEANTSESDEEEDTSDIPF